MENVTGKRNTESSAHGYETQQQYPRRAVTKKAKRTKIALPSSSGTIALWCNHDKHSCNFTLRDAMSNQLLWEDHSSYVRASCYSPGGNKFVVIRAHHGAVAEVRDLNSGFVDEILLDSPVGKSNHLDKCIVNHAGTQIAVRIRKKLESWSLETNSKLFALQNFVSGIFCFSGDDVYFLVVDQMTIAVRSAAAGNKLISIPIDYFVSDLAVSANGRMCAAQGTRDSVTVWEISSGTVLLSKAGFIFSCCFGVEDDSIICMKEQDEIYVIIAWIIIDGSVLFQADYPSFNHIPRGFIFSVHRQAFYFSVVHWDSRQQSVNVIVHEFNAANGKLINRSETYDYDTVDFRLYVSQPMHILL
jgi:WD40 repeat protein